MDEMQRLRESIIRIQAWCHTELTFASDQNDLNLLTYGAIEAECDGIVGPIKKAVSYELENMAERIG